MGNGRHGRLTIARIVQKITYLVDIHLQSAVGTEMRDDLFLESRNEVSLVRFCSRAQCGSLNAEALIEDREEVGRWRVYPYRT